MTDNQKVVPLRDKEVSFMNRPQRNRRLADSQDFSSLLSSIQHYRLTVLDWLWREEISRKRKLTVNHKALFLESVLDQSHSVEIDELPGQDSKGQGLYLPCHIPVNVGRYTASPPRLNMSLGVNLLSREGSSQTGEWMPIRLAAKELNFFLWNSRWIEISVPPWEGRSHAASFTVS